MFMKKLTDLKRMARRAGYVADQKNGFESFKKFYEDNNLIEETLSGQVMEIILCYILGMMQAYLHETGKYFFVNINSTLDHNGVDVAINHICFQVKFDWKEDKLDIDKELLKRININLIIIPSAKDKNADIIDQLVEILQCVGFSENDISEVIDNDPSLDAAVEIWDWYCRGI